MITLHLPVNWVPQNHNNLGPGCEIRYEVCPDVFGFCQALVARVQRPAIVAREVGSGEIPGDNRVVPVNLCTLDLFGRLAEYVHVLLKR